MEANLYATDRNLVTILCVTKNNVDDILCDTGISLKLTSSEVQNHPQPYPKILVLLQDTPLTYLSTILVKNQHLKLRMAQKILIIFKVLHHVIQLILFNYLLCIIMLEMILVGLFTLT